MSRPTLEVADIVRAMGNSFWEQHSRILHGCIARCSMPSSAAAPRHWAVIVISASAAAIRPSHSTHAAIGTVPSARGTRAQNGWPRARLNCCPCRTSTSSSPCRTNSPLLILQNKRLLYDLLFRTSAASLLELARDPKHLGADIGFLGVLHTWGQNLQHHPHVHYIVPAGGLALDGSRWIDSSRRFFLPVKALSQVFRGKFCEQLRELFQQDRLQFHGSLQQLASPGAFSNFLWQLGQKDWVVYAKPPFGGAEHVLNYLARYTHRVAISNHRLVAFENDRVSFRWRDYAHGGKKKVMTVSADEFLRRFLLHVLPGGLVRIRHFGLFANRRRETALARCRDLLGAVACADRPEPTNQLRCPACSGTMLVIERITSAQLYFRPDLSLPTHRGAALTAHSTSMVHDVSTPVARGHARTCKGVVRPKAVPALSIRRLLTHWQKAIPLS